MPVCGVYTITNLTNGKLYVGSAVDIRRRWAEHLRLLRSGRHTSAPLQNAWRKYGETSFRFDIVELASKDQLLAREQAWLDRTRSYDIGYNVARSATAPLTGRSHTEEAKAKIRAAKWGNKCALGHKQSDVHKARKGFSFGNTEGRKNKGWKPSAETRARMSLAAKARCARQKQGAFA